MTPQDTARLVQVREWAATGRARQIRLHARLSQAELASAIDVPPPTLSAWETGRRRPRGAAALRYCRALDRLERVGLAATA